MTRHARHLLRMRRATGRVRRVASWTDGLRMAMDLAYSKDQTVTLVYRNGTWVSMEAAS